MATRRSAPLPPSTERYVVEARVGGGAMGDVYRALDRTTNEPVAIKMLRPGGEADQEPRFRREVAVLADLRHPNIVRYIDHGVWSDGRPYLTMEWLEGEDLETRYRRSPPGLRDSVEAVRRAAAAMAAVHARGVVHRDLKLSNLWLSEGKIHKVKLIDFGVVKPPEDDGFVTQPGAIVGTPYHMAPEQARNDTVTPRADVYALGSILFLLVTRRQVFPTEHLVALLGRLLLEDAPRASSLRPDLPPALDALIARCLSRDPAARYEDGGDLSRALARVGPLEGSAPGSVRESSGVVSLREASGPFSMEREPSGPVSISGMREPSGPVSIAGMREPSGPISIGARPGETAAERRQRRAAAGRRMVAVVLAELSQGLMPKELGRALRSMLREGDHIEPIRGERMVMVLGMEASGGDEVLRAARAALLVSRLAPGARVAQAAGYVDERGLGADTIERAAALLELTAAGEARADRETTALLAGRFRWREDERGTMLLGDEEEIGRSRQLLGRPTPTVGRETEFASLATMFLDAMGDGRPRAALVTGGAGVGKSRLRYELVRWLRAYPEPPDILLCRGDPLTERGGVGSLGRALRGRLGIRDGEVLGEQRAMLRAYVARLESEGFREPEAEGLIGELIGVRADDAGGAIEAARQDPGLLLGRLQRCFEAMLRADELRAVQVIVLEDLHWVDELSRGLVGWALATTSLRLVVYAFARHDRDGLAWPLALRLPLAPLEPRAARLMLDGALPGLDEATASAIVERSGGNALFLEELIRHAAEGRTGLPLTVQALVQGRLDAMAPELRAVARAASVFGRMSWSGGVDTLVEAQADRALEELARHEIVTESSEGGARGRAWVFRHSLVREAIYATLLEHDRRLFHGRAARWLEAAGEQEQATLAWHVEQSGDLERAAELYARATAQSQAAGMFDAVLALADAGLACGPGAELRGRFLAAKAKASSWLGRYDDALGQARQALEQGKRGSPAWAEAARVLAAALRDLGRQHESAQVLAVALHEVSGYDEATLSYLLAEQARTLADLGQLDGARRASDQALALAEQAPSGREMARLRAVDARFFVTAITGQLGPQLEACLAVVRLADETGDVVLGTRARCNLGHCFNVLGRFEEAWAALHQAAADALRCRTLPLQGFAQHNLGLAQARRGLFEDAVEQQRAARALAERMGHERLRTSCLQYEALAWAWGGSLVEALTQARLAYQIAAQQPTQRVMATRILAYVQQRRGANEAALELLSEPGVVVEGADHEWGILARLTQVEALHALGDRVEAAGLVRRAVTLLLDQAATLPPASRQAFLGRIEEHRRLLELARVPIGG